MDITRRNFTSLAAAAAAVGVAGRASAAGKRKHVLVSYTWSINNIGDMGIHTGLLTLFKDKMPEVPVTMLNISGENSDNFRYYQKNLPTYHPLFDLVASPFKRIIGADPYTPRDSRPCEGTARAKLEARWGKFKLEQFRQGCITSFDAEKFADDLLNRFPLDVYEDLKTLYPKAAKAFDDAAFVYYNSGTTLNFGRIGVKDLYTFALPYSMSLLIARAKANPSAPVISAWASPWHGLEALGQVHAVLLGLTLVYLTVILGALFILQNVDDHECI